MLIQLLVSDLAFLKYVLNVLLDRISCLDTLRDLEEEIAIVKWRKVDVPVNLFDLFEVVRLVKSLTPGLPCNRLVSLEPVVEDGFLSQDIDFGLYAALKELLDVLWPLLVLERHIVVVLLVQELASI